MSVASVLKEYVLMHMKCTDKIPSTDVEVYNEYKLLSAKIKSQFIAFGQKELKIQQKIMHQKFKAHERIFQEDIQQIDKDTMLDIIKTAKQSKPDLNDFQIFQEVWDNHAKKQGLNIDEIKKYVSYCLKQIQKHQTKQ
ncbi:hypothetical protein SS50377_23071 [Spironucleus salmonicida]|uniref:Uncharacterized protein n=1 Tax=Spironucleus salmonicida TaxID=348837 RepID=V6LVA5_9EUKA|nr:hypothetical protein SS50377_23071 [Spironucleus salmonicida]|eukprot:EST47646.1 Hypothetical protein SS50377_12341 [Spironucleus salmonicida]